MRDEAAGRQIMDERSIHLLVEIKVEAIKRAVGIAEAGLLVTAFQQPIFAPHELVGHERRDEIDRRQLFGVGMSQPRFQDGRHTREAEFAECVLRADQARSRRGDRRSAARQRHADPGASHRAHPAKALGMRGAGVYRVLLRCYPAEFRHEYGGEMVGAFSEQLRDARRTDGRLAAAAIWAGALFDLFPTALQEHRHVIQQDLRHAVRIFARIPATLVVSLSRSASA